jgi:hypothetical protein
MPVDLMSGGGKRRRAPFLFVTAAVAAFAGAAQAEGDPAAYRAAVPALERAGGGKTCVQCFLERYAPAVFNKAFAVSADGAYGGRWGRQLSIDEARRAALENCQRKPEFNPANPCVIFFENDRLVWRP